MVGDVEHEVHGPTAGGRSHQFGGFDVIQAMRAVESAPTLAVKLTVVHGAKWHRAHTLPHLTSAAFLAASACPRRGSEALRLRWYSRIQRRLPLSSCRSGSIQVMGICASAAGSRRGSPRPPL